VKLGRDQGVKYPNSFTIPTDREAANLIALSQDLGINLIDTAPAYGNSEERLGTLLSGQREQWVICSKVGEEFQSGQSHFNFSPEHVRFSVERSLKRLNSEMIDIVLVHSDGNDEKIIREYGTLEALAQLKTEGKLRAFGMSTKTVKGGLLAAELSDAVMVTWNLQYDQEVPVIDYCHRHNKGVLIKKALASGHAAQTTNEDPVQQSFEMIFRHPGVSSAIVGTINLEHLKDNISKALATQA
jgi:aryl-alcohol dehydrogenase-like predicted oxidoreductase